MTRLNVKPNKYKAKRMVVDGITFDSQKEARRYGELKLLEQAGQIRGLLLQPIYNLCAWNPTGKPPVRIGQYRADFEYIDADDHLITEDVKGFRTPLYKWKRKHVEAQYGVVIKEV